MKAKIGPEQDMLQKARVRADCELLELECREFRNRLNRLDLEEDWRALLLSGRATLADLIAQAEADS